MNVSEKWCIFIFGSVTCCAMVVKSCTIEILIFAIFVENYAIFWLLFVIFGWFISWRGAGANKGYNNTE
jgi:hypothetical protein